MARQLSPLAIDIAKKLGELSKNGNASKLDNGALAEALGFHRVSFSVKTSRPHRAMNLLQEKHFVARDQGYNWRLQQPIEDIEAYLSKWIHGEKEPEGNKETRKLMIKSLKGNKSQVYKDAKSITLLVNNVTITIAF